MKARIALVTYALQVGGVETFLRHLADYFIHQGHEVSIIETFAKGQWSQAFTDAGYDVIRIIPNPLCPRIYHSKLIAETLRKYDAVILNDSPLAQAALGLLPEHIVAIPVLHSFLASMHKNAVGNRTNWDSVVAVNPVLRKNLIEHFNIAEELALCVYPGVEVPSAWPKKVRHSSKSTLRAVFIGHVSHSPKGVLHLPEILKSVADEFSNISLEVVGEGPDLVRLKAMLSEICPSVNVIFHGVLSNEKTLGVLRQADALIMPSYFEGLPLTLLESMANGVVPVISLIPGCTDVVVESGVNGFLVEIGDVHGFSIALTRLAYDRPLLEAMSRSAWDIAKKRFSYVSTGASYLELIENCSQQRESGKMPRRTNALDKTLLGDLPSLPIFLVRPVRKALRMLGLFPEPVRDPLLFETRR